ncbi:MAG: ABC transporter ATP-binding protein [Chloroflexota bacterium]
MSSEFTARTFEKSDYTSPIRFIWSHIRRHPWVALRMVVGAFSNAALASAVPFLTGAAVNIIVNGGALSRVTRLAVILVISQAVRGALQFMRNYSSETFAQRIERDVRDELYASLLAKSMTFHDFQPVGEIMARVTNDVREMNLMMNPGVNLIIGSGMFLLMPLVGIEVVKGSAQEAQESYRFNALVDRFRGRFVQRGDIEARYFAILVWGLATVGGLLHAILLYRAGTINIGDIVNFVGQISLFGFPVFVSIFAYSQLASGYASAERILNIITTRTDLDQNESGHDASMQGAIAFEGVDFGYLPGKQVLHGMSFTVEPGQTVAIVGQTGSGKSTLTKLLNRTYDVDTGQVLVDGLDVREWNLAALRSQISIIEQEIFLFSRSVSENIAFGRPGASQEQIEEAARLAQAHEFIMEMPQGYETVIGQRGVTLSGGQRQRLAIARAFLTDPRILILDDSTSAIDSATEDQIQKAIWEAAKGRTTLLITHRLSQIRWADRIIVLRQGRIVAQGRHEALLRSSEAYRRIFARYEETPNRSDGRGRRLSPAQGTG